MAFTKKIIDVKFILASGQFDGGNTLSLSGLTWDDPGPRVSAQISHAGGIAGAQLDMQVYGMNLSHMNALSTLGIVLTAVPRNFVSVSAGDSGGLSSVFDGTIISAWFEGQNAPDVCLHVQAQAGYFDYVNPTDAHAFKGGVDIDTLLGQIAGKITNSKTGAVGVTYLNPAKLSFTFETWYSTGSPVEQAAAVVQAAGVEWNKVDDGTLTIWPPGQGRGGAVINFDSTNGLIGYPTFSSVGIVFRAIFDPQRAPLLGSHVSVASSLFNAPGFAQIPNAQQVTSGTNPSVSRSFSVISLEYFLQANFPDGKWEMTIEAAAVDTGNPFVATHS